MDPTISISKGYFVFKNGSNCVLKRSQRKSCKKQQISSLLDITVTESPYYQSYAKLWNWIERNISKLQNINSTKITEDIIQFIDNVYKTNIDNMLPVAALLTGINQPDHFQQFEFLSEKIKENLQSKNVILQSRDCSSIKTAIETIVYGFIENNENENNCDDELNSHNRSHKPIKKSQCTMQALKSWYTNNYPNEELFLIITLADFECFPTTVLEDLMLILHLYCHCLPIVVILGVATSISNFRNILSYKVTNNIRLKIFQCESATNSLNQILENVILSPKCPFHLSGKVFQFLCDIFLFYDFSINGFVQGFKYCIMEHYLQKNAFALCTNYEESLEIITKLDHNDFEIIRQLPSFRPYVESMDNPKRIIAILTDDEYLKKKLQKLLENCHIFFTLYKYFLVFLTCVLEDLPKTPLGRLQREIYPICVSTNLLDLLEFKECWQMLGFLSKNEFITKLNKAMARVENYMSQNTNTEIEDEVNETCTRIVNLKLAVIKNHLRNIEMAETNMSSSSDSNLSQKPFDPKLKQMTRFELKETLLNMSKQKKSINNSKESIDLTLDYILNEIIAKHLIPLHYKSANIPPLYELFVFSDLLSVRRNIVGAPRAALHTALNNPHFYLRCDCCELKNQMNLIQTLPDISIAFKLHLESGRIINLFDWLQAFKTIVDDSECDQIDLKIQARFTRAVAELQFLGYIKTSKRKVDHVTRLTW